MQIISKLGTRLPEEDRQTIAGWRNRVIAFYCVLFVMVTIFLVVNPQLDRQVADQGSQVPSKTVSSQ